MVYSNTIILLIIISHLSSQIFADEDDVNIEYTNLLCDLLEKSNKHVFDYASDIDLPHPEIFKISINCDVGADQRDGMKHYELTLMYRYKRNRTTNTPIGPKKIRLKGLNTYRRRSDSVLRFRTKYIKRCEFKANASQFECLDNLWYPFSVKPFGCPDQHIDMRSLIAYYPYSYASSNATWNSVLFVGRTQRTIMISDWTNQTFPVCQQINDTNTNSIIPKFLFDIEKNLEITGILGTKDKETNKSLALILFYDSGQHKYCVTEENQLNISCRTRNLKTYMECSHQYVNTTDSTHSLPSNKPSKPKSIWSVIAIIAVVLVIIAIIIGICFVIYSVYRSKNKSQTGKTNAESDKQIRDSIVGSQPQQTNESSDQKGESSVKKKT